MRLREKAAWAIAGSLSLFVVVAMSGVVSGGSLDPPGPIGSTMKTLEDIPGSWSRTLDTSGADVCNTRRFSCVLGGLAVLDRETGLVWEQTQTFPAGAWADAAQDCRGTVIGGRGGWRLPSLEEIETLLDVGAPDHFPPNHPFDAEPGNAIFWTSTPSDSGSGDVYGLRFNPPEVVSVPRGESHARWCVRAPAEGNSARALESEPPSWYQRLSTAGIDTCNTQRFRCVLGLAAVLDRETGLVWQREPSATVTNWTSTILNCIAATTGNRRGWRLPTVEELTSLLVPSTDGLPPNHPFTASGFYWTSSTSPTDATRATLIDVDDADQTFGEIKTNLSGKAWCVRGGAVTTHAE